MTWSCLLLHSTVPPTTPLQKDMLLDSPLLHQVLVKECSALSVWSLGLCWRSGVLGKHCKSEVLCELLSATGPCSSIAPHSVRHFHAPLATFASNQNTGSGLTSGLTGSKVQLTHSKEERAMFSTWYMGEYAGKSIVVLWVGLTEMHLTEMRLPHMVQQDSLHNPIPAVHLSHRAILSFGVGISILVKPWARKN